MTRMLALLWLMSCASAQASNISSDRLIATARASLEAVSGMLPGELVLTASALPDSQLETEMAATTQMRLQAGRIGGAWPRKRVGVPVEVLVDGVPTQTRMVWFTVQWWLERPTYARAFASGTPGEQVVVVAKRMDVAGVLAADEVAASGEAPAAARLKHAVRAGDLVQAHDFAAAPAIARRDPVTLRIRHGAVELRLPATAVADGQPGEAIAVLPQGARTPVQARVVASGEVSIEH
ncbi:flagella basal body P-ring formation protein FlgA [Xanthomonas arboricola pv. juglandis]|uniref:flagella basal body P-ring formation protein FlgA n=3 Tax=Xanthomonas arboricola TaxID=56448 RepID=UPI00035CEA72|nr:flagella basal body P-ring formation protein FlgA [Xanthomonas arboricola]PMR89239.1 flagellar biosynthesis protein FlgA [Xanthomonas arboricola pv. juglandis]CAD2264929.1 flagella basal body P-ring formation protein FlgA [Xanthomonas arboricola]CAD7344126.1 flagella basal body P-ring formation protein FlgA [Xanthomonas arboricola]CAD7375073.1 flagella basal body P-ring formation protein FlgA [Xanthomonas arboricola]CAG2082832.1 flagella basal body P-ring formation protein FlgA [Xanthomonas